MNFIPCFTFLLSFQIKNLVDALFENNFNFSQENSIRIYLQNYFFFQFQIKKIIIYGIKKRDSLSDTISS